VNQRRTDFHDFDFSDFHRLLGGDCPMQDIDQMYYEYDRYMPIALIEMKCVLAEILGYFSAQAKAHRNLANYFKNPTTGLCLPFFVIHRSQDFRNFGIRPYNERAENMLASLGVEPGKPHCVDAAGYVEFVYWLRQRPLPIPDKVLLDVASWIDNRNGHVK
jgi:hypothetical protein